MVTPAQMYWLTRLDAIGDLLTVITAVMGTAACGICFLIMGYLSNGEEGRAKTIRRRLYIPTTVAVIAATVNTLLPSTKDMAAIIVIPRIANNESVQQLGEGIVDLANQWIVELAPGKKTGKETETRNDGPQ